MSGYPGRRHHGGSICTAPGWCCVISSFLAPPPRLCFNPPSALAYALRESRSWEWDGLRASWLRKGCLEVLMPEPRPVICLGDARFEMRDDRPMVSRGDRLGSDERGRTKKKRRVAHCTLLASSMMSSLLASLAIPIRRGIFVCRVVIVLPWQSAEPGTADLMERAVHGCSHVHAPRTVAGAARLSQAVRFCLVCVGATSRVVGES